MFGAFKRVFWRRRVIVNLIGGASLDGIFYQQDGPLLVLKNATYLEPGAEPVPLDGDTVVERDQVLFMQAP